MRLRLDMYLPFLRRPKADLRLKQPGLLYRAARRLLPGAWFSDHAKARPGLVRRALRRVGTTTYSSPVRRAVQAVCLLLFCWLFLWVCWPYSAAPEPGATGWPAHYEADLARKERVEAEAFLALDPLVGLSTAVAGRTWVWSLTWGAVILLLCVAVPRGFCGYLCPLGTLIDLFDWAVGKRITRFRIADGADGRWIHLKYGVLLATMAAAAMGVMLAGFVAAIPVVTRGLLFALAPLQTGALRGWHQVPAPGWGEWFSLALFAGVLGLGLMRKRFWCRYVCPTGAIFSLGNLFRATERQVEDTCVSCNECVEVCPFDAIKPDFTTRTMDCTLCQACAGVCPTHAIKFVGRWEDEHLKAPDDPAPEPDVRKTPVTRRGFLAAGVAGVAAAAGAGKLWGADLDALSDEALPVRPPGSVAERDFLRLCIRCGECFKACPNNVLQPLGLELGLDGLWTPAMKADWAGCEPSCTACGQVCPTGAIRPLPLEEKRHARMGLAIVDEQTCLPFVGAEPCDLCVQECTAAGYDAIEVERRGTQVDADGQPIPGTGHLVPIVKAEACVGCGLCQTRCYRIKGLAEGKLSASAIVVVAGEGKEDRMAGGSYRALREAEAAQRAAEAKAREKAAQEAAGGDFWD